MTKRLVRYRIPAFLMCLLLILGGCGTTAVSPSSTTPSESTGAEETDDPGATADGGDPRAGGTLVVAMAGDLGTTEPIFQTAQHSEYVYRAVMESLVDLDASGTEVVPKLATGWEISSDERTYTFALRTDVTFHDGTPFNAEAVKYNLDRWTNFPEELQALASRYSRVFGGFGDNSNIESVETDGDATVIVNLRRPQSNFLQVLFWGSFTISSPAALEAGDADNPDLAANAYASGGDPALVGTGPFKFSEWVRDDHVTVVRNPDYWGEPALLDQIVYRPISNQTTALNALQSGDVDLVTHVALTDLGTIGSDPSLQIFDRGEGCNTFSINMNVTYSPMDNRDIRYAIAHALDRQSYIDAFYEGEATQADNFAPLWVPYTIPLGVPTYDPDRARELIEQSGIESPTLEFWYPSDVTRPYMPDPEGLFQAMARDLEAVGFTVEPNTKGWTTGYLEDRGAGNLPMFLLGNNCLWPTIDAMYTFAWFSGDPETGVRAETGYGSPEFQQALAAALAAGEDEAPDAWAEIQRTIAEDLPVIPILHANEPGAASVDVQGFVPSSFSETFHSVWLDR